MSTTVAPPPAPEWARGSKSKALVPTMVRLYRSFGKYRYAVMLIVLMGVASSLLSVLGPQYLSSMTDSVAESMELGTSVDMDFVVRTAVVLVAIYAAAMVLQYLSSRMSWITEEIVGDNLRMKLSEKVSRISVGNMDRMRSGDVMSRFVNDTDTIRLRSTDCLVNTIDAIILFTGAFVMMLYTEWRLALVAIAPALVGFVMIRVLVKMSQKYYRNQSRDLGRLNTLVEETFRGLSVVKAYNGMGEAEKEFDAINDRLYDSAFRSRFMSGLMPEITGFINNFSYVLVCVVGSLFVLEGTATFGTIVAFIVYVKLTIQPLQSITRSLGAMQEVAAASERIFEFMDIEELDDESDKKERFTDVRGEVVFDDVSFSYIPGKEVIHHFCLKVEAGQKIAIVGPTGAGKTTIANLLLRFYDPDSGSISVDGIPIDNVPRECARELFGVVLQDTWLFQGTLRQNIVFGNGDIPDSRIEQVCEDIGLKQFVKSLPDGINTYLNDPSQLSNGQKQQITIARAMIKDAPILILDEATSSVDTRTEKHIQQSMDKLMEGRTSFIIAHRLSTIMSADKILVIKKGKIIERGTHEELLAMNGFYRNLYDSQFEYCD